MRTKNQVMKPDGCENTKYEEEYRKLSMIQLRNHIIKPKTYLYIEYINENIKGYTSNLDDQEALKKPGDSSDPQKSIEHAKTWAIRRN